MNRRNFLKTSAVTGILTLFTPAILAAASKPKISWEDFDWMVYPSELAFRIEAKDGIHKLNSTPYYCITRTTQLVSSSEQDDLTAEQKKITRVISFGRKRFELPYTIYTNETLLLEAKKLGFTHIYMFVRTSLINPGTFQTQYKYLIRGAKMPDWKTNRGKLQIVNV